MAKQPRAPRTEARDIRTATGTLTSESAAGPNEEDIRLRAYQRYLERGGGDGLDFEDWLEAERELRTGKSQV